MARHRSFKEKMAIIEYYLKHGDMMTTSKRFEVSEKTIHRWVNHNWHICSVVLADLSLPVWPHPVQPVNPGAEYI